MDAEHFLNRLSDDTAKFNKPRQSKKKPATNNYRVKSTFGQINVAEDSSGFVRITQNGQSIRIYPDEIQKLAGCLLAYKKEKYPQPKPPDSPKQTSDSYMSKQKEEHANAYQPWTPEEEDRMKELWKMGYSPKEIGEQLGRNEGAILSRLKKTNLIGEMVNPD